MFIIQESDKILEPPEGNEDFLEKLKPCSRCNIRKFVEEFLKRGNHGGLFVDVASGYRTNEPEVKKAGFAESKYISFDKSVFEFDKKTAPDSAPNLLAIAERIPLPQDCAGVVLCTEVLEHTVDDYVILKEIRRILKPGGLLILTVPGKDVPLHEKKFQRDYRIYSPVKITKLLKDLGFSEISLEQKFLNEKEINILVTAE